MTGFHCNNVCFLQAMAKPQISFLLDYILKDSDIDSYLYSMITVSDNYAANHLVGLLGGGDTDAGVFVPGRNIGKIVLFHFPGKRTVLLEPQGFVFDELRPRRAL